MPKRRKPMARTGFKRQAYEPRPAAPLRALHNPPNYSGGVTGPVRTNQPAQRNARLLRMARGMPCQLRVAGVCIGGTETTVACHSNLGIHGKAGARKADDQYHVHGCRACHQWLDQGPALAHEKEMVFLAALAVMVEMWTWITLGHGDWKAADRKAAQWALERQKP